MAIENKITSILDLLSARSATEKIKDISDEVVTKKLSEHEKEINKILSDLLKRINKIENYQITDLSDVVVKSEDTLRELIRDEVSQVFLQLYYKRNSWT